MLKVVSYDSPAASATLADRWNVLLDTCVCRNPFYGPEMLLTAWHCYGNQRLRLMTFWEGGKLVGLLPVVTEFNFSLFPVIHDKAWRYRHCYSCMPLLARGYEVSVMRKILDDAGRFGRMFSFYDVPLEGFMLAEFDEALAGNIRSHRESHQRACLLPGRDGRDLVDARIRNKRLKEFNRQKKGLEKRGTLEFAMHDDSQVCRDRLDAFLMLEESSWKGRMQTALLSNDDDRLFACTALNQLADRGSLQVYELVLDGKPLAMLLALQSGRELYTFKIAHDPAFNRYSPGVLLMLECSRLWERDNRYDMVDSCATPEHSLVNRLWYERRAMGKFHIAGADPYTRSLVSLRNLVNSRNSIWEAA